MEDGEAVCPICGCNPSYSLKKNLLVICIVNIIYNTPNAADWEEMFPIVWICVDLCIIHFLVELKDQVQYVKGDIAKQEHEVFELIFNVNINDNDASHVCVHLFV